MSDEGHRAQETERGEGEDVQREESRRYRYRARIVNETREQVGIAGIETLVAERGQAKRIGMDKEG